MEKLIEFLNDEYFYYYMKVVKKKGRSPYYNQKEKHYKHLLELADRAKTYSQKLGGNGLQRIIDELKHLLLIMEQEDSALIKEHMNLETKIKNWEPSSILDYNETMWYLKELKFWLDERYKEECRIEEELQNFKYLLRVNDSLKESCSSWEDVEI